MSIRKRLFISNIVMVVLPVIILIILGFLLSIIFSGGFNVFNNKFHNGWQKTTKIESSLYNQLIKTASIHQEKLLDADYQESLTKQIKNENSGVIIRKGKRLLFTTQNLGHIPEHNLPSFGSGRGDPITWLGHNRYAIKQHDFYFEDGAKGTIFVLTEPAPFVQFAGTFFPLLFVGLLLILALTNIFLSYLMSKSILKPVNQLSKAAEKVSEGNLDFKIQGTGKDELSTLVNTFDDMRSRLKRSLEVREQYERNRKELVANISHDLKTPITSISGYVEGIQDGVADSEEKINRYLDTIQTKAKQMDHMIDELFLYSKLDLRSLPFHFEAVNIRAFFEDYLDELRLEYRGQPVEFTFRANTIDTLVSLDRDKFIRVLNNIINNSLKYTDKERCEIVIDLKDADNKVEVVIRDNGPGISSNEITSIFNRFYRVDPSRNTSKGGSGLGLAIAAQIVEAHGGSIWAEDITHLDGLIIHLTLEKILEDKGVVG